jgi:polysaccharide pyruvyl transferase WcaK-like protein
MIIELKGVEFENKGAELMLFGILERIHLYWPEAEIVLSPGRKSHYLKRAEIGAWQKLSLRKSYLDFNFISKYIPVMVKKKLRMWGVLTESDIDIVLDASGFSYSDQWGGNLRIRHAVSEIKRIESRGGKYIFMPQAMGPFKQERTKKLIQNGFPIASLVCARDKSSFDFIREASSEFESLKMFKDFTNSIVGLVPTYFTSGEKKVCIIPNKNMLETRNKNKGWDKSYVSTLVNFINISIDNGYIPFLLNHEGKEDKAVIDDVLREYGKPLKIIEESNPILVKGIIQASKLSICSRYHGCISALSSGKACIGTSWSHKYERLYEEYGALELLVKPGMTHQELTDVFIMALDDKSIVNAGIAVNSDAFKLETEGLWGVIKSIVDPVYLKNETYKQY